MAPELGGAGPTLAEVIALSRVGEPRVQVGGVHGSAGPLLVAALMVAQPHTRLLVVPTQEIADRWVKDLGTLRVHQGRIGFEVLPYPQWDVTPYDTLPPHPDNPQQRLSALFALATRPQGVVVVAAAPALSKKVLPRGELLNATETLRAGMELDRDALVTRLSERGYLSAQAATDPGTWAIRGGVLDVFPSGAVAPIRIEQWGDEIESIRAFDPESQRSLTELSQVVLLPAREELLEPGRVARAVREIKEFADHHEVHPRVRRPLIEDLTRGVPFTDIEYHLAMFYEVPEQVLDYLPEGGRRLIVVEPDACREALESWDKAITDHHRGIDLHSRLVPPPESLFEPAGELIARWEQAPHLTLSAAEPTQPGPRLSLGSEPTSGLRHTLASHRSARPFSPLIERLRARAREGTTPVIAFHTAVQARRLTDLLAPYGLALAPPTPLDLTTLLSPPPADPEDPRPLMMLGTLSAGVHLPNSHLEVLTEEDIFGPKGRQQEGHARKSVKGALRSFSQLSRGDPVVHTEHGIGVFLGLVRMGVGAGESDFLQLEYQGGDKLYVPVHRISTLRRYVGQKGSAPTIDKLGGATWTRTTRKVKESMVKVARELLDLYAARALSRGPQMSLDAEVIEAFEASFPWDETADQLEAIQSVYADMTRPEPMDRLVCGDVGFGKTEVAMRAAWLAVTSGHQVAVLVPTTILAVQHARTFGERFREQGVLIEHLSRFRSAAETRDVLQRLKEGKVDVVIGTHRLLGEDVQFKDLGLLIIDEEHRFGVKHKERLKRLRKDIHVLTMTATPIPRTLHMAMSGLRQMSIIATPPRDRMSIRTFVVPFGPAAIQEAIRQELRRGGQVYFVHNRVRSIASMATWIQKLVPEARVTIAHGQQEDDQIEKAMIGFIQREFNVLVTTTIVESGLDIPLANTILINRADHLGLAQLYQLRGRVGRSNRRAYAYLLTPAGINLQGEPEQRLRTLERHSELGSGLQIASEDLEMRGAGNLLGESQSGAVAAVGFDTYIELLQRTIEELQGREVDDDFDPEIEMRVSAFIPDAYIPQLQEKLELYRALADASTEGELFSLREMLEDRFGSLPHEVEHLFSVMELRQVMKKLRIRSLQAASGRLTLRFDEATRARTEVILRWVTHQPDRYRLTPDQRLSIKVGVQEPEALLVAAKNLLQQLS